MAMDMNSREFERNNRCGVIPPFAKMIVGISALMEKLRVSPHVYRQLLLGNV